LLNGLTSDAGKPFFVAAQKCCHEELSDERGRRMRALMGRSQPQRQAVATNYEALKEVPDQSCPTARSEQR
jgi:hypothetical protein